MVCKFKKNNIFWEILEGIISKILSILGSGFPTQNPMVCHSTVNSSTCMKRIYLVYSVMIAIVLKHEH